MRELVRANTYKEKFAKPQCCTKLKETQRGATKMIKQLKTNFSIFVEAMKPNTNRIKLLEVETNAIRIAREGIEARLSSSVDEIKGRRKADIKERAALALRKKCEAEAAAILFYEKQS